jgi:NAD(P)-dependent dehydrogenase (short-subunit alcohol dehydrogenase family)
VALAGAARLFIAHKRNHDLTGQVALVTGGSRGLGKLIARELVEAGCHLVICARDGAELERARAELARAALGRTALEKTGGEVLAIACDLTRPADVEALVAEAMARFGQIDILVNNAGIIQVSPVEALSESDFAEAMTSIFWGTVRTTLAVLPHMRARKSGRIVNITSIGGKVAVPHLLPYDAAKFAATGFSEGMRTELAKTGISVTTIVPGLMRTGSHRFAIFKGNRAGERRWFSLAARMPGLAMSPHRAARRIVRAARQRRAETVLGAPAKLLRFMSALFPALTARLLAGANRLLPAAR